MKRLFLSLITLTFVAGCAAFNSTSQQIQAVCAGITSSVQVLTIHHETLNADEVAVITRALDLAHPVCGQGEVPTVDKVKLAALTAVQEELSKLASEVRK